MDLDLKSFEKLKKEISKSAKLYIDAERAFINQVKEEVRFLDKLMEYLSPVLPFEIINGKKAYLIYVYENSGKKTISNKVYYCEDKNIRYQVFKKDEYLCYNPTAKFEGSYVVIDPVEHFSKRNGLELSDVVQFFAERIETLEIMAKEKTESTKIRKQFLDMLKKQGLK